ncbi:hypothetical protein [uncultured Roseobacter sp.]|uniref:hypothetical protein n=1 Tax=uncultured Roseobacter sp. TaxID=114847 RepID=UPI0026067E64|nr:hypothetical protein [uncultured Roseobacter sp.]
MKNASDTAVTNTFMILLLWAGLSLGGNLIAAPAKFQVEVVSLDDLLRIGRAQFAWLGVAEILFAIVFIGMCLIKKAYLSWTSIAALLILFLQQVGLQPLLQARTDLILADQPAPSSHLHLIFIATEIAKFFFLVWAAISLLRLSTLAKAP